MPLVGFLLRIYDLHQHNSSMTLRPPFPFSPFLLVKAQVSDLGPRYTSSSLCSSLPFPPVSWERDSAFVGLWRYFIGSLSTLSLLCSLLPQHRSQMLYSPHLWTLGILSVLTNLCQWTSLNQSLRKSQFSLHAQWFFWSNKQNIISSQIIMLPLAGWVRSRADLVTDVL